MNPGTLALVATTAPLVAFLVSLVFLRSRAGAAAALTLLAGLVSLGSAAWLLGNGPLEAPVTARWLESEGQSVAFGFLLDGPNLLMGLVVALIAFLVQLYSLGYMAGDPGRSRYFALMGLFEWSMLSFVYASSLLQMFVFWELVGLASFLLIGFWYEKPEAAAAGRKAFIMTRVGDVGLFVGLILLYQTTGTLDIVRINDAGTLAAIPAATLTWIGLLFFMGVAGKSAQFPLHTWLPDAMEGPTPVSALLHSATMVAAGVFLFARFLPMLMFGDVVPVVVLTICTFTALLSATIAMVSLDIKRVLAYSSISQLSFMLIGLAAGSLFAGLFHLTTHALFKALLFLCAGAYIHHVGTNDMVAIGRAGGRRMRITTIAFLVGGAALAGVPPLAGFFSKESILAAVAATGPPWIVAGVYLAAFLTAYYTFRMIFLVLRPNDRGSLAPEEPAPASHAHHGTDAPAVMLAPIALLAAATLVAGASHGAAGHAIEGAHAASSAHGHALHLADVLPAVGVMLLGIVLAWLEFGRRGASQLGAISRIPALHRLFVRKWYVDDAHDAIFGSLVRLLARGSAFFETRGLDAGADGVALGTQAGGRLSASFQSGRFNVYAGTAAVFVAALCFWVGTR